jgi:hypothetical protein
VGTSLTSGGLIARSRKAVEAAYVVVQEEPGRLPLSQEEASLFFLPSSAGASEAA